MASWKQRSTNFDSQVAQQRNVWRRYPANVINKTTEHEWTIES